VRSRDVEIQALKKNSEALQLELHKAKRDQSTAEHHLRDLDVKYRDVEGKMRQLEASTLSKGT